MLNTLASTKPMLAPTESSATDSKNVMAVPLVPPSRYYGNPSWLNPVVETHRPGTRVDAELSGGMSLMVAISFVPPVYTRAGAERPRA